MRLQLARIFGQIARGAAALSAAFGVYGLRQFPILAPIILLGSAGLAIIATIASGLQNLALGSSLRTAHKSIFWTTVGQTLDAIRAGTAPKSMEFNAKGAAISTLGGILFLAAALTPPGIIATAIALTVELVFIVSASYWYRGSGAKFDEQSKQIDNANASGKLTDVQAEQALVATKKVKLYNQGAASLVLIALCTSVIPVIGPVIGASIALAGACVWLKAYFSTKAQQEHFEFTHVDATKPDVTHKEPKLDASQNKPAPTAEMQPEVRVKKSKGVDAEVNDTHQSIADKLNAHKSKMKH